jgi:hypothetical protein
MHRERTRHRCDRGAAGNRAARLAIDNTPFRNRNTDV